MSSPVNETGTKLEAASDSMVAQADKKVGALMTFLNGPKAKEWLATFDKVAKIATAILFIYCAPYVFVPTLAAGTLFGVFSKDQLPGVYEKVVSVVKSIPKGFLALGGALTVVAAPWAAALVGGLWLGAEFGGRYAGTAVAKAVAVGADAVAKGKGAAPEALPSQPNDVKSAS